MLSRSIRASQSERDESRETRTLIVGDSPTLREYIGAVLENAGYVGFVEADDSNGALAALESDRVDIVVANCTGRHKVPWSEVSALIEALRRNPAYERLPVVMMSALEEDDTGDAPPTSLGLTRLVRRPFTPQDLIETFHEVLLPN